MFFIAEVHDFLEEDGNGEDLCVLAEHLKRAQTKKRMEGLTFALKGAACLMGIARCVIFFVKHMEDFERKMKRNKN